MDMLGRAKWSGSIDQMHTYGALATKLLRTYVMQPEALAKLKRGGEQTVRVEHVRVHEADMQSSARCQTRGGGRGSR
jgi:hypothetical protein